MTIQDQIDAKAGEMPGGDPSTPNLDQEHFDDDSDNLIETVEIDDVGGIDVTTGGARQQEVKSDDEVKPDDKSAETETKPGDKPEEQVKETKTETPEEYHKDPAWQRIIKERDEAVKSADSLADRVSTLEEGSSDSKMVDINTLTDEEIAEWQNDDPKGFATNLYNSILVKVKNDVASELTEKDQKSRIDQTYDKYSSKYPDGKDGSGFVQMYESGKLTAFMDKNPGHNPISAHMALTEQSRSETVEDRIKKEVDAAVSKAKKEMTKEQQARIRTDGLGTGPSYSPDTADKELQDTKKTGGNVSVLARRLMRRRQVT